MAPQVRIFTQEELTRALDAAQVSLQQQGAVLLNFGAAHLAREIFRTTPDATPPVGAYSHLPTTTEIPDDCLSRAFDADYYAAIASYSEDDDIEVAP
jgi:hypothetical protein